MLTYLMSECTIASRWLMVSRYVSQLEISGNDNVLYIALCERKLHLTRLILLTYLMYECIPLLVVG